MKILIGILLGIIILAALAGNIMSNVEQPNYKSIKLDGDIEIRDYPPMILAEVEVSGERKEAIREGFKILADYIFGNNTSNIKIAMTAPVMQQQYRDNDWKVRFVMPEKYNFQTLPKPNSKRVILDSMAARRFVAIRFSGRTDDKNINLHTKQLEAYILEEKLNPLGNAILAFYNPPWTLPFLRRNEVIIEIGMN